MAVREGGGDPLLTLDDQIHKFVAFLHTPSLPDSLARTRNRRLPGSGRRQWWRKVRDSNPW